MSSILHFVINSVIGMLTRIVLLVLVASVFGHLPHLNRQQIAAKIGTTWLNQLKPASCTVQPSGSKQLVRTISTSAVNQSP